ncbi:MAG: SDR family NAD(P)-dependent oxidoreductase, partial [Bacteroidota bacterium]
GKQMDLIDLNIQALTLMSKLFIEQSENFQNARILNVSSMAGLLPGPFISVYAASKAYVFSFSMALASELKSRNIQVSVLCPADVKTNFQRNAGIVTEKLKLSDAALMVRKVYNDFMNGKRVIIPEKRLRFLKFILMFIPESVLSDSIYKKRKKLQ